MDYFEMAADLDKAVIINLPFPPSTNNLFINVTKGRIPSARYADWRQEAGWSLKAQRPRSIKGPVILKYLFQEGQDRRKRDIGNLEKLGEQMEWSIGEALIARDGVIGGNYKVTGKQAGYVYAMAEKRAKDRVILKLLNLHGSAYSEAEADELSEERRQNPHVTRPEDILPKTEFGPNGEPIDNIPLADPGAGRKLPVKDQRPIFEALQKEIHATGSIIELQEWAEKNKNRLADLKPDWQEMLRGVYSEQINGLRNLARGDDMRLAG